ncbi:uncharacterized membrane protein DDB_G0293934-like [Condylostylus longicornis]|uniref:uncharacterized membrane protein DDB_G0293934-like n=1 Tax=Condylostylus longicornis TaxID=2530218 RepID=UPI00244DD499|nr:uncharacterized membrane protein DDB_G0293934-like [Condylostylus longicornis]
MVKSDEPEKNQNTIKNPTGNGITSKGPVVYPDNNENNSDIVTKIRIEVKDDEQPSHQTVTKNNVWVANNNSNSAQVRQSLNSGITITSPEIVQIVNKDSRSGKNFKDFVPSPELKTPLTEEILHQNYMNDRTNLKLQRLQVQQQSLPKSQHTESFQPSTVLKNPFQYSATTSIPLTFTTVNTNDQQQEKPYQNQYQTQQSRPFPASTLGKPNSHYKNDEDIGSLPTSGNQYVRNEITWPTKEKDYAKGQSQYGPEYVEQPHTHQSSENIQYQTHENDFNDEEYYNHHTNHKHPILHSHPNGPPHNSHPVQHFPVNIGSSQPPFVSFPPENHYSDGHHDHHGQHDLHDHHGYPGYENNAPNGLGQYKQNSGEHPYKFEPPVLQSDSKWQSEHHHGHHHPLKHPFFGLFHKGPPSPPHVPKHYESDIVTSNEDGTIAVKGPHLNHNSEIHYEHGEQYVEDDRHHPYGSVEHSNRGKHNKYLYFKKIASIIAGIIPIGLLISALTPNYVVINPNATTVNSPVAPFTLVRQRSLIDEQQQHPQKGVLEEIPLGLENNKKLSAPSIASIIKNSKCIERSICELAAGNKNPQLLKSLLDELQRNYRNEIESQSSFLTLDPRPSIDSLELTLVSASPLAAELRASSSSYLRSFNNNNNNKANNKQSFISEDDLLRASKGVNCSNFLCDELINK